MNCSNKLRHLVLDRGLKSYFQDLQMQFRQRTLTFFHNQFPQQTQIFPFSSCNNNNNGNENILHNEIKMQHRSSIYPALLKSPFSKLQPMAMRSLIQNLTRSHIPHQNLKRQSPIQNNILFCSFSSCTFASRSYSTKKVREVFENKMNNTKKVKQGTESTILKDVSALMIKRLPKKKTQRFGENGKRVEMTSVVAYAVAEELSLARLSQHLQGHRIYSLAPLPTDVTDAIHVQATDFDQGKKDIFIFEDGSVVFWCVPELERKSFMRILRDYAEGPFKKDLYYDKEEMDVEFTPENSRVSGDVIHLQTTPATPSDPAGQQRLHLYTFSNALAQSVKLGMWETSLGMFVESIEGVTQDLKHGRKIKMSRREVLMKTGELFSLRHLINLSSDLLDTPDFYWDRPALEPLYTQLCQHLNIRRRTKVINEKLTHCVELTELLNSQLGDAHHVRLEWMIIALIMVEVMFEIAHYTERFLDQRQNVEEVSTDS